MTFASASSSVHHPDPTMSPVKHIDTGLASAGVCLCYLSGWRNWYPLWYQYVIELLAHSGVHGMGNGMHAVCSHRNQTPPPQKSAENRIPSAGRPHEHWIAMLCQGLLDGTNTVGPRQHGSCDVRQIPT